MANVFVRSPYYVTSQQGLAQNGTATIEITVGGVLRYTITKDADSTGRVYFEISELLRDYLEILLAQDNSGYGAFSHSKSYSTSTQHYNSSGTAVGSPITESGLIMDGYGYFDEGYNPTTTRGYMQTNDIIYRLGDSAVQIPVDVNNTTRVTFMSEGDIVQTYLTPNSASWALQYYSNVVYEPDSFKQRVELAGGTYEENDCIRKILDEFDIMGVDEIRVETTDGLKIIDVKTIEECRYTPVKVIFFNRWGAEQHVWFFRKSVESLNVKKESYKRNIVTGAGALSGSYNIWDHSRNDYNVQSQRSITLNTGYVDDSYNSIMQEILQSELVWIEKDNVISPVNVKDSGVTFKTGVNDKLVDYSLNVEYSYDEIQNVR